MNNEQEMLPCPFSGKETKLHDIKLNHTFQDRKQYIATFVSGKWLCQIYFSVGNEELITDKILTEKAIKEWNIRHYPSEIQEAIDRMIPKKPRQTSEYHYCPTCDDIVFVVDYHDEPREHCGNCGQKLDLDEYERFTTVLIR